MARKKNKSDDGGGVPEWLITFADLMSLLVCFFVLIISFSIQDKQKLQVVAGSIKEAFGVKQSIKKAGVIELEGVPVRNFFKSMSALPKELESNLATKKNLQNPKQGPEENTHKYKEAQIEKNRDFALAAASLRQAWQELPEITEYTSQIIFSQTQEGLNIEIVNQNAHSMFAAGSARPYQHTVALLAAMTPILAQMPNKIRIVGHTTSMIGYNENGFGMWELSSERANSVRRILENNGIEHTQFHSVIGKADTQPLFSEDTTLVANRRITITLMAHAPAFPVDHSL